MIVEENISLSLVTKTTVLQTIAAVQKLNFKNDESFFLPDPILHDVMSDDKLYSKQK